jgi:hypothetical protein
MENVNQSKVVSAVAVVPDQVGLDCPVCALTHLLWRGLDYDEAPDGVWRCTEAGEFVDTYECDCGQRLAVAFTVTLSPPPAPAPEPQ